MDISLEDDDCAIDAVTPAKKKKMKQAQLPFQISSASKSPNSTNNMSNKKKRKVISPSVGSKNSKMIKLTIKENSVPNIFEDERENAGEEKLNSSDEIEIITLDEAKKNLEQNDQQDGKKIETDTTPKRSLLGKIKKLDRTQQKSGTLTKFFKKIDKETESDCLYELKDKQNQNTFVHEEENEICLNESLGTQATESILQNLCQENKQLKDIKVVSKGTDHSFSQNLDCDITILSSDNEDSSELDKSTLNEEGNEEITNKLATPITPKTDKTANKKIIKLTPKQLEKRQEIARKKEEKLRLKKEKDKKREEEKEQKKKEKELKELKKQMEIEQKQKEKEAKEEERKKREEAKEEEKRKKEEEKLEAQRKKQKAASNFASFFVPKKQEIKSEEDDIIQVKNFMPFEIKADMRIAPICRRTLTEEEKSLLDRKCNLDVQKSELYLENIKKERIIPRTFSKTWPLEAKDDDIVLLDEDNDGSFNIISDMRNLEKHRPKLLQFSENRRPPYWGTWRKQSKILNPRRPFAKEKNLFDYEIDSDDEWEEEEPGESLKGSDDEKDEENLEENEYDVDNEFMVPHGYLSEEEAQADEEEVEDMTPQTQKMKLKILGEQFEAERNIKTYKLKPKIIGCIWQGPDNSFPESVSAKVKEFLTARQAWISNIPIVLPSSISSEEDILAGAECKTPTQQSVRGPKKTKFPDEALPDLIKLLHGNTYSRRFLMKEFMTFWSKNGGSQLSKVSVLSKINEVANRMACPEEGPMHLKSCWYVSEDIRKQYLPDEKLSLPNSWTYILTPSRKSDTQDVAIDKAEKEEKEKKHIPLITQFTKKITQEEMKKQLITKPDQIPVLPKLPPLQRQPKRATLLSVGRGEQFPEKSRENMLAKFVGLNKKNEEEASSSEKIIVGSDVPSSSSFVPRKY
ncbi:chromatin assembly factor 1 subunit A-B isoform X2 [Polyergus mexicanus]